MKDIELLQYVHETAEMGILGLQDIVGQVQTAKLKKSLQGQIAEYQTIASEAAKLLQAKGTAPKDPSLMARLSSEVMSTMQTLADSSGHAKICFLCFTRSVYHTAHDSNLYVKVIS